jgi:hypothetical protein
MRAIGSGLMAGGQAIVRRLAASQTLGDAEVSCSGTAGWRTW